MLKENIRDIIVKEFSADQMDKSTTFEEICDKAAFKIMEGFINEVKDDKELPTQEEILASMDNLIKSATDLRSEFIKATTEKKDSEHWFHAGIAMGATDKWNNWILIYLRMYVYSISK